MTVRRVLFVDDEPCILTTCESLVRMLFADSCEVVTASCAEAALPTIERAREEGVELLVLSDFNMGTPIDGLELLERTRALVPGARLVLLSGYPREDFDGRPEIANVGFIPKPFSVADIRAVVRDFVRA